MKCITLEYPDGTVRIRGGIGPETLARTVLAVREEVPINKVPPLASVDAEQVLDSAFVAEKERARDLALDYILTTLVPKQNSGATARIEDVEFPSDRDFRDAWKRGAGCIEVDMPKARQIHCDRMRAVRAPKLADLDIEYQRADERGDAAEKRRIAAEKQALRDVTDDPAIEAAKTPEDLKRIWPIVLQRRVG